MLCSSIIFVKISHIDYEYSQNILYKNLGNPLLLPSYLELGLVHSLKRYKSLSNLDIESLAAVNVANFML